MAALGRCRLVLIDEAGRRPGLPLGEAEQSPCPDSRGSEVSWFAKA
jgi:hypothetical protein